MKDEIKNKKRFNLTNFKFISQEQILPRPKLFFSNSAYIMKWVCRDDNTTCDVMNNMKPESFIFNITIYFTADSVTYSRSVYRVRPLKQVPYILVYNV